MAFGRRTALRGAAVFAAGAAVPGRAGAGTRELTWELHSTHIGGVGPLRSRIVSGVPEVVRYGEPVVFGPVIVQLVGKDLLGGMARAAGYDAVSAKVTAHVVVTDARQLSGRLPVAVEFPRTVVPDERAELVLTGTATLAEPASGPRNAGPMTVAATSGAAGVLTLYRTGSGAATPLGFEAGLASDQDPLLATLEVR
ncbi:hypothetical protein Amsp01_097600 [Amycolatopsis sp. NBRC 101858]|uniref:hypothetical protein n=1 Tax=Amycolatopsis sp. NBRC 101858 TaxID=3032200 RepID=UPI00249FF684|nr:hypothetical protein [Amycolatopsis sp. NBRC 101858]GLY43737.1 hypothetical protein Amsp01_097600 [Amycolatopsis sp. NBRC 101858]